MMTARIPLSLTLLTALATTVPTLGEEAPWMPERFGKHTYDSGGEEIDAIALKYVTSIGVDSFHWYRNDAIGGDTYDIDSMMTNVAAPFQIAVEVEGTWDLDVHTATAIKVYSAGAGTSSVSAGTLTLTDGFHIIFNDTAAGGSELLLDIPGPGAAPSGSGSPSGPSGGGSGPSGGPGDPPPTWDEIYAEAALVEWGMEENRLHYRFVGNNAASTLWASLHQASGSGQIDLVWYGDTSCPSISMPAEFEQGTSPTTSGSHLFEAGDSGSGPWSLDIEWGPEPCDADLNGDGTVNHRDMIIVFSSWGPCP